MKDELERPVCPHCLEINDSDSPSCLRCGGPLLPIATVGPYERIATEGFVLREAATRPKRLIVVVGIWLLCFPIVIVSAISVFSEPCAGLVSLLIAIIPAILIFKTTQNYLRHRRSEMLNNNVEDIGTSRAEPDRSGIDKDSRQ